MLRSVIAAAFFCVWAGPALADAIDGDWCGPNDRHIAIKGPEITTPSGTKLRGDYHRHQFDYVAPPGDTDASGSIHLQLLSEDYMNFFRMKDGKPGEPQLWLRCEVIS